MLLGETPPNSATHNSFDNSVDSLLWEGGHAYRAVAYLACPSMPSSVIFLNLSRSCDGRVVWTRVVSGLLAHQKSARVHCGNAINQHKEGGHSSVSDAR